MLGVYQAGQTKLIVGRDEEEKQIKEWFDENLSNNNNESHINSQNAILYLCGYPGQGKTAIMNQVLHDYYEDQMEGLRVFKYNAMSFTDLEQFIVKLRDDIEEQG